MSGSVPAYMMFETELLFLFAPRRLQCRCSVSRRCNLHGGCNVPVLQGVAEALGIGESVGTLTQSSELCEACRVCPCLYDFGNSAFLFPFLCDELCWLVKWKVTERCAQKKKEGGGWGLGVGSGLGRAGG